MIQSLSISRKHLITYASIIASIAALGSLSYGGYYLYKKRLEKQAQYAFSNAVKEYQKLVYSENNEPINPAAWQEIEVVFSQAATRYSGSALAPFFLSYTADILLKTGKADQARETLSKAVAASNKKSPFSYALQIKYALLELDSSTDSVKAHGLELLEQLAGEEENNPFFDKALYYLGYHYRAAGNGQKAAALWADLQRKAPHSYWAQRAEEKEMSA
jgi:tetratricopeptide (TPR) repeat protein